MYRMANVSDLCVLWIKPRTAVARPFYSGLRETFVIEFE